MGNTEILSGIPLFKIHSRNNKDASKTDNQDGCQSENKKIIGTYIHGLFDSKKILSKWIKQIGIKNIDLNKNSMGTSKENNYNLLKKHFEKHINL